MKRTFSSYVRKSQLALALTVGAFCAIDSSAQPLYSVNALGYVDVLYGPGYNFIGNPLNAGDNTISNLFRGVPDGSLFLTWDAPHERFATTNSFASGVGWEDGTVQLTLGQGAFVWVPTVTRVSFAGEPWGSLCLHYPPGKSVSSVWPLLFCGFCLTDPCEISRDDVTIWRFDRVTQSFIIFESSFGSWWDISSLPPGEAQIIDLSTAQSVRTGPGGATPEVAARLMNPKWDGSTFSFQFEPQPSVAYCVKRKTSLGSGPWETLTHVTSSVQSGLATVTDSAATNSTGFYRLECLRLRNPVRSGTTFSFQFRAEDSTTYQVSRADYLTGGNWQPILTVTGSAGGGLITATDTNATNAIGYYRVSHPAN